jgi:hypothetical protein
MSDTPSSFGSGGSEDQIPAVTPTSPATGADGRSGMTDLEGEAIEGAEQREVADETTEAALAATVATKASTTSVSAETTRAEAVEAALGAAETSPAGIRPIIQNVGATVYNIMDPTYATGGTPGAGTASADTTAITNAVAAMKTAGSGRLYFPPGLYKPTTMPTFAPVATTGRIMLPFAVSGEGKSVSIVQPANSTLATSLTVNNPAFNSSNASYGCAEWSGLTIDGTNATGTAVGVAWGDVSGGKFRDFRVANYTAADGFFWHNNLGWTEEMVFDSVLVENCANLFHFQADSTGFSSYDYWDMTGVIFELYANQNGWTEEATSLSGGIQHVGSQIRFGCNAHTGTTNTGSLFLLKGNSQFTNCEWGIHAESDGSSVSHHSFTMQTSSSYVGGFGVIDVWLAGNTIAGGGYQFQPVGYINVTGYVLGPPFVLGPAVNRGLFNTPSTGGSGINAYPSSVTNGTSFQNTTGTDMFVTVPVAFTAAGTAKVNADTYSSLAAGPTVAAGPSGVTVPITFVHLAGGWARIDVTNATIGAPMVRTV